MVFRLFFVTVMSVGLFLFPPNSLEGKEPRKEESSKKSSKASSRNSPYSSKKVKKSSAAKKDSSKKDKKSGSKSVSRNKKQSSKQKTSLPTKERSDTKQQKVPYIQVFSDRSTISPGLNFWIMVHFKSSSDAYLSAPNQQDVVPAPTIKLNPPKSIRIGKPLWPAPSSTKKNPLVANTHFLSYDKPFSVLIPVKAPFYWGGNTLTIPISVEYYLCGENICDKKVYKTNITFGCDSVEPTVSPHQKKVLTQLSLIPIPAEKIKNWNIQIYPSSKNPGVSVLGVAPSIQRILYPRRLQVIPAAPLQPGSVIPSYEVDVVPSGSSSAKDYKYQIRLTNNSNYPPSGQFYLVSDLPWDEARKNRVLLITASSEHSWKKFFFNSQQAESSGIKKTKENIKKTIIKAKEKSYINSISFLQILWYSFLGGLILNLMPCVFPVLSIKILSIISAQQASSKQRFSKLWGFNLGVLFSFLTLAGIIVGFQRAGQSIGWGFQLQSPQFVTFLIIFFLSMTANFWGWVDIPSFSFSLKSKFELLPEFIKSFFSGCITTLVATPCTGPFLGIAMGFSLSKPPLIVLLIFTTIAVGMVTPINILYFVPFLSVFIPKPGVWMENLKMFLSFPLLATCMWLAFIWAGLLPNSIPVLLGIACVGWLLAFWLFGKIQKSSNFFAAGIFASLCVTACIVSSIMTKSSFGPINSDSSPSFTVNYSVDESIPRVERAGLNWLVFSKNNFEKLLDQKKNLFVMVTANWCIACKMKEAAMIHRKDDIAKALQNKNIIPVLADLTRDNPEIQSFLTVFNRMSIPFSIVFPNGDIHNPIILPDGYSMDDLINTFSKL